MFTINSPPQYATIMKAVSERRARRKVNDNDNDEDDDDDENNDKNHNAAETRRVRDLPTQSGFQRNVESFRMSEVESGDIYLEADDIEMQEPVEDGFDFLLTGGTGFYMGEKLYLIVL